MITRDDMKIICFENAVAVNIREVIAVTKYLSPNVIQPKQIGSLAL